MQLVAVEQIPISTVFPCAGVGASSCAKQSRCQFGELETGDGLCHSQGGMANVRDR